MDDILGLRLGQSHRCRVCGRYHGIVCSGNPPLPLQSAQIFIENLERLVAEMLLTSWQRYRIKNLIISLRKETGVPEERIISHFPRENNDYNPDDSCLHRIDIIFKDLRALFDEVPMVEKQFENFSEIFKNAKKFLLNPSESSAKEEDKKD